jgi:CHAT domain-containing protein/Tfp pilus assembly protein PilF
MNVSTRSASALARGIHVLIKLRVLLISLIGFWGLLYFFEFASVAQTPRNNLPFTVSEHHRDVEQTPPNNSYKLELQKPIERNLASNDVHHYQLEVMADYFFRVRVLQDGIDLVLTLRGPHDEKILQVDSPNGTHGPESLSFIAKTSGTYTVAIAPLNKRTPPGRYLVTLEDLRVPISTDWKRIQAEEALAKALHLRNLTEESKQPALAEYYRAVTLFREVGDHYFEGLTDRLIANTYLSEGKREDAIERFNNALQLFRNVHAASAEAAVLNDIGHYYLTLGQNQVALQHHERALMMFRDERNIAGETETLNYMGHVNYALGDYKKALERFEQVVLLAKGSYYKTLEARGLEGIGACYLALNEKDEARKFYKRALKIQQGINSRLEETRTLVNLVRISIWLGDRDELYRYYDQTLLLKSPGSLDAENYSTLPTPGDLAVETYNKALSLSSASGDLFEVASLLNDIGSIHLFMQKPEKALDSFNRALITNKRIENLPGVGYTLDRLMNCWKLLGNTRLAIFYGKQAVNLYQEMRGYITENTPEFQVTFLRSKERTYRVLGDLLISEKRLLEAQQVLNLLKEEEFFQFVGGTADEAITLNSRASLTSTESHWATQFENLVDLVISAAKKRSEFLNLVQQGMEERQRLSKFDAELRESNRALDKFLNQLRANADSGRAAKLDVEVPEAKTLIKTLTDLGADVVALFTLVSEDRYSVLLVSPRITKAYQYPIKKAELGEKIADLLDVLRDPSSDPIPLAREMYSILIGPVADDLKKLNPKTLMWSLDDVLRTIPISALHDGQQYMVQRYQIVVFTPTSQRTLTDTPSTRWKANGFGVSKEHGDFPDLPGVPDELDAIIRDENRNNAEQGSIEGKTFIDEQFTERAFLQALRDKSPVIHIATHFHFVEGNALDSFLVLGDGNHLSLRKIKDGRGLFIGVDLLTLSACDTATTGKESNGKEVDGLAEFAQRQGAKAVVATLWQVADYSTQQLMQRFYAAKQGAIGVTKADALRTAQLKLLSCNGQQTQPSEADLSMQRYIDPDAEPECFSHPYYWAPFILIGNWK